MLPCKFSQLLWKKKLRPLVVPWSHVFIKIHLIVVSLWCVLLRISLIPVNVRRCSNACWHSHPKGCHTFSTTAILSAQHDLWYTNISPLLPCSGCWWIVHAGALFDLWLILFHFVGDLCSHSSSAEWAKGYLMVFETGQVEWSAP